jgi:hypothetical protein
MSTEFKITDELVKQFLYRTGSVGGDITRLYEEWEKFKESKKPKPLFTTKDNISVFEKDICWAVRKDNYYITSFQVQSSLNNIEHSIFWYFGSEDCAKDWILYDKPLLSLKEIESIGQIQDPDQNIYFKRLVKAAKDKLNQ